MTQYQRLFIALYIRDGVLQPSMPDEEDKYHWAFLLVPKDQTPTSQALRINARNYHNSLDTTAWYYEEIKVPIGDTPKLLCQKYIGDIINLEAALETLRDIPLRQGDPEWNCVLWVQDALEVLRGEYGGTKFEAELEWLALREEVMEAAREMAHIKEIAAARKRAGLI
ncbi:hypothetical protein E2P81_ATG01232 [Venturia nashicola]|uniref:Uncharacterized protein n=1 Tax=Venturia nashicola TaxID=86259 RepID=A0A4Z1PUT6_9PEZI|nr:hypothetical protein E6O75_ATG01262 [Venturia nashicola]TLD38689.1 hypothetical protein E2P81_ATG01232 [Venturia nashicola]